MRKDAYRLSITDGDGHETHLLGGPLEVELNPDGWIIRQNPNGNYTFEGRGETKDIAFLRFLANRLGIERTEVEQVI